MKYPRIATLVPQGEHFDESAIINEGGFLSVGHLSGIEAALENNNLEALEQANATITDLTNERDNTALELSAAQENLETANNTIATHGQRIIELEGQLAQFTGGPSGEGSVVTVGDGSVVDDNTEKPEPKSALSKEDHPVNAQIRRQIAAKKEKEAIKK